MLSMADILSVLYHSDGKFVCAFVFVTDLIIILVLGKSKDQLQVDSKPIVIF